MADLLMFVGLVSFVVAIILFGVRLLLKRGWNYKRSGILAGGAIVLFILGAAISGPSLQQGYDTGKQAPQNKLATQGNISPEKQKQPVEPVKEEEKQKLESEEKQSKGLIPDIEAADIKLNLEKWGLKFTGPRPFKDDTGYLDDGEVVDPDTQVKLSCTIMAKTPMAIQSVTFRADGALVAGNISPERYLAVSKGFLGYCATLPYDGSEPEKAREWVEKNLDQANQPDKPIVTVIGQVEYKLAGAKYFRLLSMKPIQQE